AGRRRPGASRRRTSRGAGRRPPARLHVPRSPRLRSRGLRLDGARGRLRCDPGDLPSPPPRWPPHLWLLRRGALAKYGYTRRPRRRRGRPLTRSVSLLSGTHSGTIVLDLRLSSTRRTGLESPGFIDSTVTAVLPKGNRLVAYYSCGGGRDGTSV